VLAEKRPLVPQILTDLSQVRTQPHAKAAGTTERRRYTGKWKRKGLKARSLGGLQKGLINKRKG